MKLDIPTITDEYLGVEMIQPTSLAGLGAGGETFKAALASWNSSNFDAAGQLYERALREGLIPLAEGAARTNLGQIMLQQRNLTAAIQQFLAILKLKQATFDSINDASQYLSVMLAEIGRVEEARALDGLAKKAQARLGYSLKEDAKESLRNLVCEFERA
jgi:tetratricopeptide (TPR) repeat protein